MKLPKPETLGRWELPDTEYIPDGTDRNFRVLLEEYNKLVDVVHVMAEKLGIELEEE